MAGRSLSAVAPSRSAGCGLSSQTRPARTRKVREWWTTRFEVGQEMEDLSAVELMTKHEYVSTQTALDKTEKLESANSVHRIGNLEAMHLQEVRNAARYKRPIHADNMVEYLSIIPELSAYSINGNVAVYDASKPRVIHSTVEKRRAILADEERQEMRRIRRVLKNGNLDQ